MTFELIFSLFTDDYSSHIQMFTLFNKYKYLPSFFNPVLSEYYVSFSGSVDTLLIGSLNLVMHSHLYFQTINFEQHNLLTMRINEPKMCSLPNQ